MRDLTNERFGMLLVESQSEEKHKSGSIVWNCVCDCGNRLSLPSPRLLHSGKTDCGCQPRKLKSHGMYNTPTYRSWVKLCCRTRYEEYAEWHGDVEVCERWDTRKGGSFENFLEDMGERPEGKTINRINGAKIYSKETCEWADISLQAFDQRKKKNNTSGKTGVNWNKEKSKWETRIHQNGKTIRLGYYDDFELACFVREEAELKYYGFTKE